MKPTKAQIAAWRARKYSWSQHSSFEYDPWQWYCRYILGHDMDETPELKFGKKFADAVEWGKPLAPLTVYKFTEHCVDTVFDGIPLIGYLDSYDRAPHDPKSESIEGKGLRLAEYKTGKKPWTQKRVDQHGQLTFYALLLWLRDKVKPEDLEMILQWVPTCYRADFSYGFTDPAVVHTFETSRTMQDVLKMAGEIKTRRKAMEAYVASRK